MKTQKRRKTTKSLKHGKAVEKKRPLLTYTFKEVFVTSVPMSTPDPPPPPPPTK